MSQHKQIFRLGLQLVLMSFLIVLSAEKGKAQNLTQVSPQSGAPGSAINLYGAGFDANAADHIVTFTPTGGVSGTDATPSSLTNGKLTVDVPAGLSAGNYQLSVTRDSDDATATLTSIFSVLSSSGGSFNDISAGLTGVINSSSDWGDYDNDGDLDLILTGNNSSGTATSVIYRNDGGGTFTDIGAEVTGVTNSSTDWGDYDGDGDLDLIITGTDGNEVTTLYKNDGAGGFTTVSSTGITAIQDGSAAWGDYDNDGDLDLLITGLEPGDGGVFGGSDTKVAKIYQNNGDDTFTNIGANLTGVQYSSGSWGDFDDDGDLDLIITGENASQNNISFIYRNDGGGTFSNISAGLTGVINGSSEWGDYDGDGDPDLLITGTDDSTNPIATIYRNDNSSF